MKNTNNETGPAYPFDTCPLCHQVARVKADYSFAKHGPRFQPCLGAGLTAPSFVVSVTPVVLVPVAEFFAHV